MKKVFLFLFCVLSCVTQSLNAQDIHFSHIHASPTFLNPAMVGLIDGGDIRLIANARSQWNTFTNGYKTIMGSADLKLFEAGKGSLIGGGLQLYADQAGDLDFTTMMAGLTFSGIKALDRKGTNLVSVGFHGSYINNRMDYSKMIGFQQETFEFDGVPDNIGYFDFTAGIGWFYAFDWHSSFHIGLSMAHINKPDVSFLSKSSTLDEDIIPLFRKFTVHGGANLRLAEYVTILPSFIYVDQGPHKEITLGTFTKYKRDKSFVKSNTSFYLGAWLRWYAEKDLMGADALVASARMDVNKTYITFSYDFNFSKLNRASRGMGGAEISIIQIISTNGPLGKNSKVTCPAF